jgi:carboxylesterase
VNFLFLAIAGVVGWLVRRSVAHRVEQASLLALPRGLDGIIAGAAPIDRRASDDRAVLILHGFGDTPQTVGYLADYLHRLGFTVRAPLLAGHGRTLREFGRSTADQWLDGAMRELVTLQAEHAAVGLVGVSMGGALAAILAAEAGRPGHAGESDARVVVEHGRPQVRPPEALVLIAPYLSMRAPARRLAAWHWVLSPFIRYLPSREEASIRDPAERRSNRGFGTVTPRLLGELQRLVMRAQRSLTAVTVPTLVIQSRGDNRIEARAAEASFSRLGATDKRFEWTEGGGHVITVDVGRDRVFALAGEWLLPRVGRSVPSPADSRPS